MKKYLITAAVLSLAIVATASAAYPTKPNGLRGPICANRQTGVMRWVKGNQLCKKHEVRLMVAKGQPGAPGKQGIAGINGAPGAEGATGAKGDAGVQAPKGEAGPAGADGIGLDGIVSSNAEECANGGRILQSLVFGDFAVCNGFDGTAGAAGAQGPQGVAGTDGAQGATGNTGPAGQDGAPGAAGTDGAQGPSGPKGDTGPEGPAGPKGDTGAAGPQGPAGPAGINGSSIVEVTGSSSTVDANQTVTATANCVQGQTAISGGFDESGATSPSMIESRRLADGSGWVSKAKTQGGSQQGLTLTTYAYCTSA